jgi:hypothetical protein
MTPPGCVKRPGGHDDAVLALPRLLPLALVSFAACGARTALDTAGAGGALATNPDAASFPDGEMDLPDGTPPPTCREWAATHGPVQVSNIPSIVEVMNAVPAPGGVLVGYADAQFPPVDSSWHERFVALPDGTLGPEQTPLLRNSTGLGWTAISLALTGDRGAATASDQTQGMQFVAIDSTGAPFGAVVNVAGDPGRYLLPTSSAFSVLRSAFDDSGTRPPPVELAMLDPSGNVLSTRTVLPASTPTDWYTRTGLPDGSFLLVWDTTPCPTCRAVRAQHLAEDGTSLAEPATLHTFGPMDYGDLDLAPSSRGVLVAWTEGPATTTELVSQPFEDQGTPRGARQRFAAPKGSNGPAFALAAAPGGDLVLAWADGAYSSDGHVYVQAVAADGSAEGPATTVAPLATTDSTTDLVVVASSLGAMVFYESDIPGFGIEVFGVPLHCLE